MRYSSSLLLLAFSCGSPGLQPDTQPDALDASTTDGGFSTAPVESPTLPETPSFLPCPSGWREIESSGVPTCSPWPEDTQRPCDEHSVHYPGETSCTPIGPPCPVGDWPEGLPVNETIIYVSSTASVSGSGTRASPYRRIQEAIDQAPPSAIIALQKGTYPERLVLDKSVTIWGACVAETTVSVAEPASSEGVVIVPQGTAILKSLRVTGERVGIWVDGLGTAHLEGVLIDHTKVAGLAVTNGAEVTGSDVVIRNTDAFRGATGGGRGLFVSGGSRVSLERLEIAHSHELGAMAAQQSELSLSSLVIRDTSSQPTTGLYGCGVDAQSSATVNLRRAVLISNREAGIFATNGALVSSEDLIVRDTRVQENEGLLGQGIYVFGAEVNLSRALFDNNTSQGLVVLEGGVLRASDVIVSRTQPANATTTGDTGRGIEVTTSATATLDRVLVDEAHEVGILIGDMGSATLRDITVLDTQSRLTDLRAGLGLAIWSAVRVDGARILLERNREVALALREEVEVDLSDITIRQVHASEGPSIGGFGIGIDQGADVTLRRILVERAREAGLVCDGVETSVALSDLTVRETNSRASTGLYGRGLEVTAGCALTLSRAVVADNLEAGIVIDRHAVAEVTDLLLHNTQRSACYPDCPGLGSGIVVLDSGYLRLGSFRVASNELAGLQLVRDGEIDASHGVIEGNRVGVNIQMGFDLERLQQDVIYRNNGVNLDSTELPVPSPFEPFQ